MKTKNEQIAEIMGLVREFYKDKNGLKHWVGFEKKDGSWFTSDDDFSTSMILAKLLQAKMVADGWMIEINIYPEDEGGGIKCLAHSGGKYIRILNCKETLLRFTTESAALHALFCKIYGIDK